MSQRNREAVHAGKSTVYHLDNSFDEQLEKSKQVQLVGSVTVTGVNYIIEADGELTFSVVTDEPRYVNQKDLSDFGRDLPIGEINILITTPEIHAGDVFDIYSITDPYLCGELGEKYGYTNSKVDATFFFWKLRARFWDLSRKPLIDLRHPPADCPFCGLPLEHAPHNRVYCTNPDCDIFRMRDFSRFLNFCLRAPAKFTPLVATCIRHGALVYPSDLYLPDSRKLVRDLVRGYQSAERHVSDLFAFVDEMQGRVKFSDYVLSLPFTKSIACVDEPRAIEQGRYLCARNIDEKFGKDPMAFVELIQLVTDNFMMIEDYSRFKDLVYPSIRPYMSFTVYHDLARFLAYVDSSIGSVRSYVTTISELSTLSIFQP